MISEHTRKLHPIDRIWPLFAPLSRATTPLRLGFTRRRMAQAGIEQRAYMINGMSINCYVREISHAAAPLLFVHGLGDSALTWSFLFEPLARHSIYALDLPGYGFSALPGGRSYATIEEMRDLIVAFAHEHLQTAPIIVGNSMGGWLAIEAGLVAPESIAGLVLLNPGGALLDGANSYAEFRALLEATDLASARLVLRRMFGSVPIPLLYASQSALQAGFQRSVVRDFIAELDEAAFLNVERLGQIGVPTTLIWGETDAFLPSGTQAFFCENLRGAEQHILAGVGHLPHAERPKHVAQIIEQFVAQTTG